MTPQMILIAVLAIAAIAVLVSLIRRGRAVHSSINLEDLLLGEDGRISKAACVMLGSFLMTTWVIVFLTYTGNLTEGYYTAYLAAWVAPTIAKVFKSQPVQAPAQPPSP